MNRYDRLIDFDTIDDEVYNFINNTDEKILLYNIHDPHDAFPIEKRPGGRIYLFDVLTKINSSKFSDIGICLPDIHLFENFKKIKHFLHDFGTIDQKTASEEIDLYCFPWAFVLDYYSDFDLALKEEYIPTTRNIICLSGGRKIIRMLFLGELSKYDNFIYSNMGYHEKSCYNLVVDDIRYCDDEFEIFYDQNKSFICNGDFTLENAIYEKNNYKSSNIIKFENDYSFFDIAEDKKILNTPKFKYVFVPKEFLDSIFSFTVETQTTESTHLTEKTLKNIFYKKPFLSFAGKNFYKFLSQNGFFTYTELFDYSFDRMNYIDRYHMVLKQMKNILTMDPEKLYEIINSNTMKNKINRNYENAKSIDLKIKKICGQQGDLVENIFNNIEHCINHKLVFHERL